MIIAANRVGKNLDDRWVLSDVSFVIERGERIGLVGPNGSGKTTLLRLLAGVMEPDRGEVFLAKGARIGYLEQIPQADPGATVQDV
ncbi:MAG: ATP-binding cassette domain-containing protein, partial [Planifilum sp.]